ncbi:MAG TPA: peptidase T [Candidatus Saccharimonadales bacterium]|nr:peptidase T [Candidatus Saccharimonadales bacterium]
MPEKSAKSSVVERFLRYVTFDTQSDENSTSYPSTEKQLLLLDRLVEELRAIGLQDAQRDAHGYVFATVPATSKKKNVPVVGFIAHVDTSPEAAGAGVKPLVHRNWQGQDLVLPDDPAAVLRLKDIPELQSQLGNDIITASGATLLGADNKAGVAEIVAAAEFLVQHPEIPHGAVRLGFTPDEEVGGGTKFFDVGKFGAYCAYTLDGESLGQLQCETFSADAMTLTFQGFNTHPGYAKGRMINSIKVAADFVNRLPKGGLSPETTEGREGFVHPYVVDASVDRTSVKFLIRDFATPGLADKEALLEKLARETAAAWPGASVSVKVEESYRNMKEVLDQHPRVVEYAREAIHRVGLAAQETPVRGGTDGARLSFMQLPTPNLFAGEHNFHSRLEWVSAQDMEKAVEVIVELAKVWEEKA